MDRRHDSRPPRAKRARYTTAACDGCKRQKLKCIRRGNDGQCERCEYRRVECHFADKTPPQRDAQGRPQGSEQPPHQDERVDQLVKDVACLQQQVARLTELAMQQQNRMRAATDVQNPKEPRFVAMTRPTFGLNVAREVLSANGDDASDVESDTHNSSRATVEPPEHPSPTAQDPLLGLPLSAVMRLLDVFHQHVQPTYPLLSAAYPRGRVSDMIEQFRNEVFLQFDGRTSQKDIHLLKVILATGLVLEKHGKDDLASHLIASFEDDALRITSPSDVDLQEARIFAVMSIYHFHCDEELLAYRSIGIAARMALEMGLHRRRSLHENFPGPQTQSQAIQLFWCIYVLDRRWSFGTGLSFALIDRDLDPCLPEPSATEDPHFRCLVAYAKLCSKVWEAVPQYGSPSDLITPAVESSLVALLDDWSRNIPTDLRRTHPPSSDRSLHSLQTLMHLRGNYIRCLIHRHNIISPTAISRDTTGAQHVVDVARDSIRVIIRFHDISTEINSSHTDEGGLCVFDQAPFNFFLMNAISVLLLAVCHAAPRFESLCQDDFFAAVDLIRRGGNRRLWLSIRGLVRKLRARSVLNDTGHDNTKSVPGGEHTRRPESRLRNDTTTRLTARPSEAASSLQNWAREDCQVSGSEIGNLMSGSNGIGTVWTDAGFGGLLSPSEWTVPMTDDQEDGNGIYSNGGHDYDLFARFFMENE